MSIEILQAFPLLKLVSFFLPKDFTCVVAYYTVKKIIVLSLPSRNLLVQSTIKTSEQCVKSVRS